MSTSTARFRLRGTLLGGMLLGGILLGGTVLLGVPAQAAGVDVVTGSSSVHVLVGPNRTTGVTGDPGTGTQAPAVGQSGTGQSDTGVAASAPGEDGVQAGAGAGAIVHPKTATVRNTDGSKGSVVSSSGRGPAGHARETSERPVVELEQGTTQDQLRASGRPSLFWWAWLLFVVPAGTASAWWVRRNREQRLASTGPLYS